MTIFDPRVLGASPVGLRRERIEGSPRYKDGRFHNTAPLRGTLEGQPLGKRVSIIGEFFFGRAGRSPKSPLGVESPLEAWQHAPDTGLRATWLGHSTVVVEIDGVRVMTDPVFAHRVSPVSWTGPERFHRTPVSVDELPPLDVVIVSHDHFDHLCYETIRNLAKKDVTFVTSLGVGAHLEAWGVKPSRVIELDWWEKTTVAGGRLEITATPSRHFSGRGAGANRTAWSSFVMDSGRHRVFFSGDTGLTPEFETIRDRAGRFDLVMLEVGAFHPAWGQIHLGPDNAIRAVEMLGGGTLLPVHWGTFDLGLHPWEEPAEVLATRAAESRIHLVTPRVGRAIEPARVETFDPWWRDELARQGSATAAQPRLRAITT